MSDYANLADAVVAACGGDKLDAMALLAGAVYQLAFHAADEAATNGKPEGSPYAPIEAVRLPSSRMLRRVAEQMLSWASGLESIEGPSMPMMRKRIASLADGSARDLACRLRLALKRGAVPDDEPWPLHPAPAAVALPRATREPARRCEPQICPKCGALMLERDGRYGPYRVCERSPACPGKLSGAHLGVACVARDCDGHLIERLLRTGGDDSDLNEMLIGCSNYPDCRFAVYRPVEHVPCFFCKMPFMVVESLGKRRCIDPVCASTKAIAALDEVTGTFDVLSLASRAAGSLHAAAPWLATAGGFACGQSRMELTEALDRFARAYDIGANTESMPKVTQASDADQSRG